MLVQFHTYSKYDWIVFFLVIPVFWIAFSLTRRLFARELKSYLVTSMALMWSRWLCPLFMLIGYVTLTVNFGEPPAYLSLPEAINAQQDAVADMTGSALVSQLSQYLAMYGGVKAYALGRLGNQDTLLALALMGIGDYVVFYNTCAILACFLIPAAEYRRVFGPLSDADEPQPVPPIRIAAVSGITFFLTSFVFVPLVANVEDFVGRTPIVTETRKKVEETVAKVEQIGNDYFKEGTLKELYDARIQALHKVEISLVHLEGQVDRAFDRLEANVDGYLDWYYSLAGEYARIARLLQGELEDYMTKKFQELLQQGDAFQDVQAALNISLTTHDTAQKEYQEAVRRIMDQRRIDPATSPIKVVQRTSLEDALNPPVHPDVITLKNRLALGGGGALAGAAVTGIVSKKIVEKVVGKGILKLGAKALAKVVTSKAAGSLGGAAAGAAAGAAIGSAFPGIGTAIGAAIGGIIGGLAVGVTVDKMILMLEEAFSREKFKVEILAAIKDVRMEFKAELKM